MRAFTRVVALSLALLTVVTSLAVSREKATVARVIDGDTVELRGGEKVRLIGIDAAEPGEPFGDAAAIWARSHLEGELVWLEYGEQKHDKFGRLLAHVFLDDGTHFNLRIIENGYARAYTKYPFKAEHMASFLEAERRARNRELGVWATSGVARSKAKTATYWLNTSSRTLHNSACRWYGATKAGTYTNRSEGKRLWHLRWRSAGREKDGDEVLWWQVLGQYEFKRSP